MSYLNLSFLLFIIGSFGMFLINKHILMILISLELILLSSNINFICFSALNDDIIGQIYALFVITIAAAESSLGLAIFIVFYRLRGGVSVDLISLLKS
jgi:NADH-quinone oxidoreductase subunit K